MQCAGLGVRRLEPPELRGILAELKERLGALYGDRLLSVVLFGSQARGDAEAGSDIDVLVVLRDLRNPVEEIGRASGVTADVSLNHDVAITCLFRDEDWYAGDGGPLYLNIHREGVVV
jgi:predicted nucleotidyltransferase